MKGVQTAIFFAESASVVNRERVVRMRNKSTVKVGIFWNLRGSDEALHTLRQRNRLLCGIYRTQWMLVRDTHAQAIALLQNYQLYAPRHFVMHFFSSAVSPGYLQRHGSGEERYGAHCVHKSALCYYCHCFVMQNVTFFYLGTSLSVEDMLQCMSLKTG